MFPPTVRVAPVPMMTLPWLVVVALVPWNVRAASVWVKPAPNSNAAGPAARPMVMVPVLLSVLLAPRRRTPPLTLLPPVQALVTALVRVRTPVPCLVRILPATPVARPPATEPFAAKVPEKVVEVLSPPTARVFVFVFELKITPDPEMDPMVSVWLVAVPLMSSVPEAPMVTGVVSAMKLEPPPWSTPLLMKTGPLKVLVAPLSCSVPVPSLVKPPAPLTTPARVRSVVVCVTSMLALPP